MVKSVYCPHKGPEAVPVPMLAISGMTGAAAPGNPRLLPWTLALMCTTAPIKMIRIFIDKSLNHELNG